MRRRIAGGFREALGALMVLGLVAACSGTPTPAPRLRPMRDAPAAVAAIAAKQPTVVRVQGKLWLVGLPVRHGWARDRRVLLTKRDAEHGIDVKVGVVVVLDDTYAKAAPVGTEYAEPGASFDGAQAELVGSDERLRIGRGYGIIRAVLTTREVELNLGRQDGVGVGDVYAVLGQEGVKSIGRVRVVALENTRAKAEVINAGPLAAGMQVVYQPKSAEEHAKRAAATIVVCNFEPKAQSEKVAAAGQAFAFDLAKHLREAAGDWKGLEVKQVPQMVGDDEQARKLGRDYQADVVVWGTAMCWEGKGCAQPVFTMVEPNRLATAKLEGKEVRFDPINPGGSMERGTARDPAGLVFGLLGALTFRAQRYGDAAYYLGRVPEGALEGEDRYRALRDLGQAQYFLGHLELAMDSAVRLEHAGQGKDRRWEMVGVGQRARILADKGEVDEALKLHEEALAVYEALGDQRLRALALGDIARIHAAKGDKDRALKLHWEAQAIYEAAGDWWSRAVMLGDIARILTDKGEVDEALELHREARVVFEAVGDGRSRAVALVNIARILRAKGEVDEALKLHREAQAVFEALGDERVLAATLYDTGQIHLSRKEVAAALPMLRKSYAISLGLGDVTGIAFVGTVLADALLRTGAIEEAEPIVARASEALTKIGRPADAAVLRVLLRAAGKP